MKKRAAFSLVELSIVLVILGLLVGGVLAGQSLVKAAGLRKVISFQTDMQIKFSTFKDKYFAIPGDMANATSFWPTSTNGNGDGYVSWNTPAENFYLPQHLNLAGLDNTRVANTGAYGSSPYYLSPGMPSGTLSFIGAQGSPANPLADIYANTPPNGTLWRKNAALQTATLVGSIVNGAVATPEDVWQIDSKLDDSVSTTGNFRAMNAGNSSGTCLVATSPHAYDLANTGIACRFICGLI